MSDHIEELEKYLVEVSEPFSKFYMENRDWFVKKRHSHHPSSQKEEGGMAFHTLQVIRLALKLNQHCDRRELIECCLVHDIRGCESLPLTDQQRLAIAATKGLPFLEWRHTDHFRFVALVLICDMWSAFINEDDLII